MTPESLPIQTSKGADAAALHRMAGASRFRAYWTLYELTLRQHLHGKRLLVVVLLFLLAPGLGILIRATTPVPPEMLEFLLLMMFVPHLLLPLMALIYASGVIQDELEEQTITYLLVRPIPKWVMYGVKLLATFTTAILLTVLLTAVSYAAVFVGAGADAENVPLRWLKVASIHSLSVVAYCSLFGLLSLLTKKVLIVGVIYAALVEGLLANLPFGIRLVTVIYYSRLIAVRTMEFIGPTPDGRTLNYAADAWQLDVRSDPNLLEHPALSACLTVLLVGSLVCTILAARLCTRREFHVKTPEKE